MKKSDLDELLERYLSDQVTEEERVKIEKWLNVMKTENKAELDLSPDDEQKIFDKITNSIENPEWPEFKARKNRRFITTWSLGIAASVLFIISASILVWKTYYDTGSVRKIILNDGTLVWLRGESTLNYYEKPDQGIRFATLQGEALFEVAKDSLRPFVIECGGINVRVLGTSFNLRTSSDSILLEVLTGKVNVFTSSDSVGIIVKKKEKVVYALNREVQRVPVTPSDISDVTADTEYNMEFDENRLSQVLDRIEQKFDVKISLSNKEAGECKINGDFTDRSLETTLRMISKILDIEYSIDGNMVLITGQGCN